jgi:hypothetical protein
MLWVGKLSIKKLPFHLWIEGQRIVLELSKFNQSNL